MRKKVLNFTKFLQSQTEVPLWSLQDSVTNYFISTNQKVPLNKKSKAALYILKVAYHARLSDGAIFLLGLVKAIPLWLKVKQVSNRTFSKKKAKVFLGFGATIESLLYQHACDRFGKDLLKVSPCSYSSIAALGRPSFFEILHCLYINAKNHTNKLKVLFANNSKLINIYLLIASRNIGEYSFYLCLFGGCEANSSLISISVDMRAFASACSKSKAIYLQHGLLQSTTLFPNFSTLHIITKEEANYLREILPGSKLVMSDIIKKSPSPAFLENIAIILCPTNLHKSFEEEIRQFMRWCSAMNIHVILRLPLTISEEDKEVLVSKFNIELDDSSLPLSDLILQKKAKFVVSWISTGLYEALAVGVVPISLVSSSLIGGWPHNALPNPWVCMRYPIKDKILFFDRDLKRINAYITTQEL